MKTTIYLVRHAEAQSNANPLHVGESFLTEEGVKQAKALAEKLKNKSIDGLHSSTVLRAKLTAEEIEKTTGVHFTEHSFLKERKGIYSPDLIFTADETFESLKTRLVEAKSFMESLDGKHVVVSHAIFIKAFIANIMTNEIDDEKVILNISDSLIIDHATISKLIFNKEKGKWRVASLNSF